MIQVQIEKLRKRCAKITIERDRDQHEKIHNLIEVLICNEVLVPRCSKSTIYSRTNYHTRNQPFFY